MSLHRNIDTTAINMQKYFHENSGFQLREYSAQDEHRNQKRHIKKSSKGSFTLPESPLPQAHAAQGEERSPPYTPMRTGGSEFLRSLQTLAPCLHQ